MKNATFNSGPDVADNSVDIEKLKHGEESESVIFADMP
jgi:hypothetical protein